VKRPTLPVALFALSLLAVAPSASAQLLVAEDGPVVYGHHHINATNIEEHKRFFANTLGGTAMKVGVNNTDIVKFPNVLIFLRVQTPTGGSKGTTANHIGFSVPNMRAAVDRIKASGFKMITATEVAPGRQVKDDIALPLQPGGALIAFAMAPDEVKVELVEAKEQKAPIQLHHIHFFGQQNMEMREWYAKTFGARLRNAAPGAAFVTADLPGVALNFSPSPEPVVGTQGRSVDHVGFEVKNLEAFTKKLQAEGVKFDRPYAKSTNLDVHIAFFKDPWGTYIELTDGLNKIR
jgi:catechol 2,3-dioxygenase-like lactoylglutathione lyase family enzyme/predicted enzyme related to lactoylglutathione lyase